jgi:uncharacterized protein YdeI (YjbR/CyaY-like superfamily)
MGKVQELPEMAFASARAFHVWLNRHHRGFEGIWLRIARKGSGLASVTVAEAVETAICFGWIDGPIRRKDAQTYLVRFGPRGRRSVWSKLNRAKAAMLIEEGRMQPPGLSEVERARQDGRWDAAYDSPRTATVPADFQAAIDADPRAKAFFATVSAANRYAMLWRLQTVKKAETRAARIQQFVAMLREERTIHATPTRRSSPSRR